MDDELDPVRPEAPVSEAELGHAVERLHAAAAEGVLTYQELVERIGRAHAARTRAEVEAVTGNLPAPSHPAPAPPARRWLAAVIGDERLSGRWTAPSRLTAVAVLGDVIVDLRDAAIRGDALRIHATALVGDVHVLVPRYAAVEMSGVAVLGRKKVAVEPAEYTLAIPVVRVSAVAIIGDVIVATQLPTSLIQSAQARWKKRRSGESA